MPVYLTSLLLWYLLSVSPLLLGDRCLKTYSGSCSKCPLQCWNVVRFFTANLFGNASLMKLPTLEGRQGATTGLVLYNKRVQRKIPPRVLHEKRPPTSTSKASGVPPRRPQFQCCLMAKQTPDINGRFSLKPSCARILHNIEIWGAGFRAKTKAHTERWAFFAKNPDSGKSTLLHAKHTRVTYAAPAHTQAHKGHARTTRLLFRYTPAGSRFFCGFASTLAGS